MKEMSVEDVVRERREKENEERSEHERSRRSEIYYRVMRHAYEDEKKQVE